MTFVVSTVDLNAIRERYERAQQLLSRSGDHPAAVRARLAHSAADVPALLAEVERLTRDVDERDDELSTLRQDLDFQTAAAFDNQADANRLRVGSDVVDTAIAYVNAPSCSDEVEQCWWELKNAVGNYERAVSTGDGTQHEVSR